MSRDQMRIFAAVGPLGAGKTTLTINTLEELTKNGVVKPDQCAYIINDEGSNVDGALASKVARILPMTNGCFTCEDVAELRELLDRLANEGIAWVFLEGFGAISGDETSEFLASCPYLSSIVCVLDHRHHARNIERYSDVMKSHIRAATIGIGITKCPPTIRGIDDFDPDDKCLDFIAEHGGGKPIFFLPEGGYMPLNVFQKQSPNQRVGYRHRHVHDSKHKGCCHPDCNPLSLLHGLSPSLKISGKADHHSHTHNHDHLPHCYSFTLQENATFDNVKSAFSNCPEEIIRVKGAVDGKLFNEIYGDWRQTKADNRRFVTFYAREPINIGTDIPSLAKLIVPDMELTDSEVPEASYVMLRKETGNREKTVQTIKDLLGEIPATPKVIPSGQFIRIITHPESLQLLKEVSRRPSVKEEWFPIALERCMKYWIDSARIIEARSNEVIATDLPKNQRELGVSLSWWATHYGKHFTESTLSATRSLKPGEMTARGVLALKRLNSDPERAYWQSQEIACAARFGLLNKENAGIIREAIQHGYSISKGTTVEKDWQAVNEELVTPQPVA